MTRTFRMDELLARIGATFRRSTVEVTRESRVIEAGDFRVDTEAHTAAVDGLDLQLTPEEFEQRLWDLRVNA